MRTSPVDASLDFEKICRLNPFQASEGKKTTRSDDYSDGHCCVIGDWGIVKDGGRAAGRKRHRLLAGLTNPVIT